METRKTLYKVAFLLLVAGLFGIIFGSRFGIMGEIVESLPFILKTKIILSFSIFGFLALTFLSWIIIWQRNFDLFSDLPVFILLGVAVSCSYGFLYQDCAIFNFCNEPQESSQNCTTTYDKAGAFLDCE
ncbi:MAG: hypothetical protein ACKOF9_04425 [Burkholderiales bacterium]